MTKPNGWTGGPWTIEFGDTVMAGVEGRKRGECSGKNMVEICQIATDDFDIPKRVAKANMKLIAAAPSLYEALQAAHMALIGYLPAHRNAVTDEAIAKARTALSAVEGGV